MQQDRTHLDELLEAVKKEFDSLSRQTSLYKDHHQEYELKINQQHQELNNIRNTVYELEQAHRTMKDAYEKEILRLKQDLENRDRLLEQQSLQQQQAQAQQVQQVQQQAAAIAQARGTPQFGNATLQRSQQQAGQQSSPKAESTATAAPKAGSTSPAVNGNATSANTTANTSVAAPAGATSPAVTQATPAAASPVASNGTDKQVTAPPTNEVMKIEAPVSQEELAQRAEHNKPIPAFLKDFDSYNTLPYKKQHPEYYLVYNPKVPKKADISMVHSFDHNSVVCCVRFSKDGRFLATGCNKLTQVFSVETGDLVARLSDETGGAARAGADNKPSSTGDSSSTPAGTSSTGADGNNNGAASTNTGTTSTNTADEGTGDLYIRSVAFSPDGKFLATGAEDKIIRIWDLATRTVVKYLKGHEQDIYSLDFFPDGTKLVSGSGDRTVRIWDVFTGQCSLTLSIEDGVTTVAVSPDGKLIAAGSLDRTVRVWDANQGFLVERLDSASEAGNGHMDSVYSVTFTHNGHEILSGSLDRTVKLWSLKDLQRQQGASSKSNCEVTYVGHKDFVLSVCCTPDDEFVLSGSKDRGVILWDKVTGVPYIMLQGHRNSVISVAVSPVMTTERGFHCGYFATGSGDCKARIWRWERSAM